MDFGRIEFTCHMNGSAKDRDNVVVELTLVGQGDEDVLLREGITALRHRRIMRLTLEAEQQGCRLCYDDLRSLLSTSLATLKRDITTLEKAGFSVPLRNRRKSSVNGKQRENGEESSQKDRMK